VDKTLINSVQKYQQSEWVLKAKFIKSPAMFIGEKGVMKKMVLQ